MIISTILVLTSGRETSIIGSYIVLRSTLFSKVLPDDNRVRRKSNFPAGIDQGERGAFFSSDIVKVVTN